MKKTFKGAVKISVRPEYAVLGEPADGEIPGTVTLATFLGDFMNYEIQLGDGKVIEVNEYTERMDHLYEVGDKVSVHLMEKRISVFDAATEKSLMDIERRGNMESIKEEKNIRTPSYGQI